jgi:hypothetical protein
MTRWHDVDRAPVIASAAKQSIASARKMDCFVAALLAMTASAARGKFASPAAKISHLHLCPTQAHIGPSRKAPSPIGLAHIESRL